jgi:hypothetical protein
MSYKYYTTIDPMLYDLNVFYEKDLYNKATNFGLLLAQGVDQLEYFIEWNKSLVGIDPITSQSEVFANLDKEGLQMYSEIQYKVFWYERYLSSIAPVKRRFNKILKNRVKVFKDISDSIGLLRNVEYLPDDSLLAIYDVDFNLVSEQLFEQLVPVNYATSLDNKIKPNSKILTAYMSRFCTSLFRHNMYQLGYPFTDSKVSHGSNLVVDYYHYDRIYNVAKEELEADLTEFYGSLYDIITFYEQYNPQDDTDNLQLKEKGAIWFSLEGLEKKTDYLKKEVGFYKNIANSLTTLGTVSV